MAEVQLPDRIELTLTEVRDVLKALDEAELLSPPGSFVWRLVRAAITLLTGELWPDLGRWLDDEE